MKRLALAASLLGILPVCAQISVLEDFNDDGDGVDYFSTSYNTGSDFFARFTVNPVPGHDTVPLTFTAPQGGGFWASEDVISTGNPLGTNAASAGHQEGTVSPSDTD